MRAVAAAIGFAPSPREGRAPRTTEGRRARPEGPSSPVCAPLPAAVPTASAGRSGTRAEAVKSRGGRDDRAVQRRRRSTRRANARPVRPLAGAPVSAITVADPQTGEASA